MSTLEYTAHSIIYSKKKIRAKRGSFFFEVTFFGQKNFFSAQICKIWTSTHVDTLIRAKRGRKFFFGFFSQGVSTLEYTVYSKIYTLHFSDRWQSRTSIIYVYYRGGGGFTPLRLLWCHFMGPIGQYVPIGRPPAPYLRPEPIQLGPMGPEPIETMSYHIGGLGGVT